MSQRAHGSDPSEMVSLRSLGKTNPRDTEGSGQVPTGAPRLVGARREKRTQRPPESRGSGVGDRGSQRPNLHDPRPTIPDPRPPTPDPRHPTPGETNPTGLPSLDGRA